MTMNADELPLPNSGNLDICHKVDGMRELSQYSIANDSHFVRWDTVIDGITHTVVDEWPIPTGSIDMAKRHRELMAFIVEKRAVAKEKFEAIMNGQPEQAK